MTYVKVSVPKSSNNAGVGGDKKSLITFFDFDDVQLFPPRNGNGIVITDNILLKDGAYMIQVYASTQSISITSETEGDEDARGIIQQLVFSHPGSDDTIEEFLTNWMNRDVGVIVENCSTNRKRLLGTPCAPLVLEVASEDSNAKNDSTLTLKSKNKSAYRPANYKGTLTFDEAFQVPPDSTSISLSSGQGRYQLSDNSDATVITACNAATDGLVFTLIGSGGSNPAVIASGNAFILRNGAAWSAIAGAEITFTAIKDGAASFKFIELSRKA